MKKQIQKSVITRMLASVTICVLLLTGCIKDDLSDCPPETENGKVLLNLFFKMHTEQENNEYKDLFAQHAQKIDIYIFDENNVFVKKVPQSGPFGLNYHTELELAAGKYSAVVWANVALDAQIALDAEPIAGVTKKEDMSVKLASITDNKFSGVIQPLLWGETTQFTVLTNQRTDVGCGLIRDDNRVKINITWVENSGNNDEQICAHRNHADSTLLYIDDNNGILGFDNIHKPMNIFTHMPSHTVQPVVRSGATDEPVILQTQTDMLRLMKNSATMLRICRLQPDGSEKEMYRTNLREKYLDPIYTTQEMLDRRSEFNIDITLQCENQSFIVVSIVVDGWKLKDNGDIEI